MGTPDFSCEALRVLALEHEVVAVYTRAPKPAGRGMQEQKSPVHLFAQSLGLPVFTPKTLRNEDEQAVFAAHKADIGVVVAYGLLLPLPILVAPKHGCLNIHASLLPRWRGAAPLQRAIMAGDATTGLTIMQMDEGLDTGAMALRYAMPLNETTTLATLHDALKEASGVLILDALAQIKAGQFTLTPQPLEGVTYAHKITKSESLLDFSLPARQLNAIIRAIGGYFESPLGRIKVLEACIETGVGESGLFLDDNLCIGCGQGALRLLRLQKAGGKPMRAADFQRGQGAQLGLKKGARVDVSV
jgi:methionyl-tRNA formyltransferase